jgi:Tfp pilus assembly protein PilO
MTQTDVVVLILIAALILVLGFTLWLAGRRR